MREQAENQYVLDKEGVGHVMKAGACCEASQGPSLAPWAKKMLEECGVGVLGFLCEGRVAPPPGILPTRV